MFTSLEQTYHSSYKTNGNAKKGSLFLMLKKNRVICVGFEAL